jgi:DMSO/TMAO reductase YedYZ molybdopterin-dependent catalytic subunit
MIKRSLFLGSGAAFGLSASMLLPARGQGMVEQPFANGSRPLAAFPQKRALIQLSARPPLLETPFSVYDEGVFTPNDAFFVRWHLSGIPTTVDAAAHRIAVRGLVSNPMQLSVDDLRRNFPAVELAAVCQCAGNSRGFFEPRVAGGEWANGAMGNALWKGARLRDILNKSGLRAGAVQVRFRGLDQPVFPGTPPFIKALDVARAMDEDVLVAYEMNGKPLPLLNGYPVRLVVPGWYATYWCKMLSDLEVTDSVDDNFWMKTAYRIPDTPNGSVSPDDKGYKTIPINKMPTRSFFTNVQEGARLPAGPQAIRGIAFDSGTGIKSVQFSSDGALTWTDATLERDYGRFSFRRWNATLAVEQGRSYTLAVRATSTAGEQQPMTAVWNPGGYLRSLVERVTVVGA